MKRIMLNGLACALLAISQQGNAMTALADQELAAIDGQALLNMQNTFDPGQNINFHKLGLEALMEINVNVKTLQLGCGGQNGTGKCDIDISNIALSGPASGTQTGTGAPTFTGERAESSAQITNPFIEFAISGKDSATREILGFRLGAEQILGLLTLGTDNIDNPQDGIKSFSGYMKMARTTGYSYTKAATFGNSSDQKISGILSALGQDRTYTSKPGADGNTGITVPSMRADFTMPETVVTGKRIDSAVVSGIRSTLVSIPLAKSADGKYSDKVVGTPDFSKDQLYVTFPALIKIGSLEVGDHSYFKMNTGSTLENLKLDITFVQALNMIHNIPLSGTGGYLSLQSKDLQWLGTDEQDVAKAGWWMSFKDPIQLGELVTQDLVDVSSVLPQVAKALTNELIKDKHLVDVTVIEALGSLAGTPITRTMNIDVGSYTDYYSGQAARLTLSNQVLTNQTVTPNCFGGHKFC